MRNILVLSVMLFGVVFSSQAIKIDRTVFPNEIKVGGEIIVSVNVKKEGVEGFARLIETVPEGFKAEELNSATGNFIFENGKIRIIWLTMPEGDTYKAEYRLVHIGNTPGVMKLDGKFHYVNDDKRLEISLPPFDLVVKKVSGPKEIVRLEKPSNEVDDYKDSVSSPISTEKMFVEIKDSVNIAKPEVKDSIIIDKVETEDLVKVDKTETKNEKIIDSNSELFFKVQLGAYSSEKPISVFGNLPDIHFVKVGNIYKYYSGKFTNEAEARAIIPKARAKGFKGAFLVRFKDGKRI